MKFQTENQLKGRWGELIAAFGFPAHWVVRPLSHDYGIDLQVEVFEPTRDSTGSTRYRTTGGHLACQVKTTETVLSNEGSITFVTETADLRLAESMGASAPLLLLLVERSTRLIYYLCLNDYVAKILDHTHESWRTQGSVTLKVPQRNVLDLKDATELALHWQYFRGLAYRSKLYAAASSFVLASAEIDVALEDWMTRAPFTRDENAVMQSVARRFDDALTAGLAAINSDSLDDLREDGSPYAGMFDILRVAREGILASYPLARRDLLDDGLENTDDDAFSRVQGEFEVAANRAAMYFRTTPTIGRIYEQTHREAALRATRIPYDVGN